MNESTFVQMPVSRSEGAFATDFSGIVRPRHHHRELEFNLVLRGTAQFAVGTRAMDVAEQQLLWFLPHQDHVLVSATRDLQMWIAAFDPDVVLAVVQRSGRLPPLYCLPQSIPTRRFRALAGVCASLSRSGKRATRGIAHEVLTMALAETLGNSGGIHPHPAVTTALRMLEANVEITRKQLALQLGMAPEVVSRLFTATMGTTIPEFKNRIRLGRFVGDIEESGNVLRSALLAGFGSYAQFHRVVRMQTGDSPSNLASLQGRRGTLLRNIDFEFT